MFPLEGVHMHRCIGTVFNNDIRRNCDAVRGKTGIDVGLGKEKDIRIFFSDNLCDPGNKGYIEFVVSDFFTGITFAIEIAAVAPENIEVF